MLQVLRHLQVWEHAASLFTLLITQNRKRLGNRLSYFAHFVRVSYWSVRIFSLYDKRVAHPDSLLLKALIPSFNYYTYDEFSMYRQQVGKTVLLNSSDDCILELLEKHVCFGLRL